MRRLVTFGVAVRVIALGTVGVTGLLLVGAIYLLAQRTEVPLQRAADLAMWVNVRYSFVLEHLAEARQAETSFLLRHNSSAIGQHMLAIQEARSDLAAIAGKQGLPDAAQAGAAVFAQALAEYEAASRQSTDFEAKLLDSGEGSLRQAVAAQAVVLMAALGPAALLDQQNGLQRAEQALLERTDHRRREYFEGYVEGLADTAGELRATQLPIARRLGAALAAYRDAMKWYVDTSVDAAGAVQRSSQLFEDASADGHVARGLARAVADDRQTEISTLRDRTGLAMRLAIAGVALAGAMLSWWIGRGISVPLIAVADLTRRLAGGDRAVQIGWAGRRDEIGQVAGALNVFRATMDENVAAVTRIHALAHFDMLTGLANRSMLRLRLEEAIGHAHRLGTGFGVAVVNLDGFRAINDLWGQEAGDKLLAEVAARLRSCVQNGDTVSRMSGDEFAILLAPRNRIDDIRTLIDAVLARVAEPYAIGTVPIAISASAGVALYPADGADHETLLGNAVAALDRAKAEGHSRAAYFQATMDMHAHYRRVLQQDLQAALAGNQLQLHWQPIAQARADGQITGFEVLLRWNHPERGDVSPTVFVPIAEACGLITSIGAWVVREACREAAEWDRPLVIAVNVSPVQLEAGDVFAQMVEDVLTETGLAPHRLVLEVTEGVLMNNSAAVMQALCRVKQLGVLVALDDFGTGYSSLATLRAFPFDRIKIDRSFTAGIATGGQDAAIISAVAGLAHALHLPVVAEGVETAQQRQAVCAAGCEEVQGWFIGYPGPIELFSTVVRRREPTRVEHSHAGA